MSAESATVGLLRPSAMDIATGWAAGLGPRTSLPPDPRSPREALDDAIRPALLDGPCYVTFSGGRDSSAVLAAATALARREGLPEPIPVTRVYPDDPASDESEWQRLVLDHLGLHDWVRLELRRGETDLLGDTARDALRRHGLLWPPALQSHGVVYREISGGAMLTGEGGDEVLGSRRGTPLTLLRRRRRITRGLLTWAAHSLAPGALHRQLTRRGLEADHRQPWLREETRRRHHQLIAADESTEPLTYAQATWWITRRRSWAEMTVNQSLVAAEHGVRASNPLLDHGFIAALAHFGGRWGFAGRTATMRALFADVLPDAVLARASKASFNTAYAGEATREFAATWDGSGVDAELVDPEQLREVWLSDAPTMSTALLLHSAWLAAEGRTA